VPLNDSVENMMEKALEGLSPYPLYYHEAATIQSQYGNSLEIFSDRDQADYIYLRDAILNANGFSYRKSRQYISGLMSNYNIIVEPMDKWNRQYLDRFLADWLQHRDIGAFLDSKECSAAFELVSRGLLKGFCVVINGRLEAIMIYDWSVRNVTVALFLKANRAVRGLTDFCYRALCQRTPEKEFVNLCQDLGIPGLRTKKLRMEPCELLAKYQLRLTCRKL
jgi:hypothetical protein